MARKFDESNSMLRHLTVRDFALVREVQLDFEPGLTVLTGESGAGKTILLAALGLVMGDRANTGHIRDGADRIEVTAELELRDGSEAAGFLIDRGLVDADAADRCLLRRVVGRDGRSRAFINGTPVNLADLATLTHSVIDIHAQNEHQLLLNRPAQLELLDDYAGALPARAAVSNAFRAWESAKHTLAETRARTTATRDRRTLLDYQVTELSEANLDDGEYEAAHARFRRLAHLAETRDKVAQAVSILSGESEDSSSDPAAALRLLEGIDDEAEQLAAVRDLLRTALAHLDEAGTELRRYADSLEEEPEALAALERRLDLMTDLARKHRVRPEDLPAHARALIAELDGLAADETSLTTLTKAVDDAAKRYATLARTLSETRHKAAKPFARGVSEVMRELGIKGGALEIAFTDTESASGIDAIDFRVRTNPKSPSASLKDIASGGERSRISLAIDVVAAEKARLPALVLDEADVGIGGTTADVVGRLLKGLSRHTQVLCVTHAPQVAAIGNHHVRVGKTDAGETILEPLSGTERIEELARMLGGREITRKTREYAAELIEAGGA